MFKNVASQKIRVFAYDYTTGQPKTGDSANITAYVSKDYGAVTVLGDTSATESDATNAPGSYLFDLTQGETNADCLDFSAKSSTSNIRIVPITVYTDPPSYTSFVTPTNLTAAQIATGVWQDTTAGDFTTAGSIGKSLFTSGVVPGGTNGLFIAGTNAATVVTTSLTTTFTGNLTGSVASVTGAVGSVTGAVGSVTGAVGSVTGNVGGNVVGTVASVVGAVGSVTGNVGGSVASLTANNDKTGYALTAGERNSVADALLDRADAIETAWTLRKVTRIAFAALGGKASGLETTTAVYRSGDDTKNRITATVDVDGNRSAVTLDGT